MGTGVPCHRLMPDFAVSQLVACVFITMSLPVNRANVTADYYIICTLTGRRNYVKGWA